jgi:chromosome segregation protein
VHLKTLTLRGFKSFASATTLQFEPGITCVVGPNGSGKSNVVDALAWVMGEQGAKSLRGGAMSDVIFAGTRGRPALGRAEVVLTIDNADRALPTDAAEVTISRTLFRNGSSEYAINSQPCRLLDVTELLADSGIGREMHVIVGQGQLDTVLHATPEVRRGLVEEAAGVLKHRKRKEKALRKLDATAANMARLSDLTAELRRQLTPLARQAEAARRAAGVAAQVRDARLRLLADDLVRLDAELARDATLRTELLQRRASIEASLAELTDALAQIDAGEREQSAQTSAQAGLVTELAALRERVEGTLALSLDRSRRLLAPPDLAAGPDPDAVDAEAAAAQAEVDELAAVVEAAGVSLSAAVAARESAEQEHAGAERLAADRRREQSDRRDAVARLESTLEGVRSSLAASRDEAGRVEAARAEATARAQQARRDFQGLETGVGGLSAGEHDLDAEHAAAEAAVDAAAEQVRTATEAERRAERERAAAGSRIEALSLALGRPDATGALLADPGTASVLRGTLAAALSIEPGAETAIAAALGEVADAAVVDGVAGAADLLAGAASAQLGRAVLVVAHGDADQPVPTALDPAWPVLPTGLRYLVQAIAAPQGLHESLCATVGPAVMVADLAQARAVVGEVPGVVAVTSDGTLLARHVALGGPAGGSRVELQAELDQARDRLVQAEQASDQARFARSRHESTLAEHTARLDAALAALHESDAELAAVAERLAQLGHEMRSAEAEAERLARSAEAVQQRITDDTERLAAMQQQWEKAREALAEATPTDEPSPGMAVGADGALAGLADRARHARQDEVQARLELRTGEERLRTARARHEALTRQARTIRAERASALARHRRATRQAAVAAWVAARAHELAATVAADLEQARVERDRVDAAAAERRAQQRTLSAQAAGLREELQGVVDALHRDEVALAELRLKVSATHERAVGDWGVDPQSLVDEYGPHLPVPAGDPDAPPVAYDREQQQLRAEKAERALARLGRINPLALEEHAAAEERLVYLTGQVDDLQSTRRDLLAIVREVDDRVETVFAEAFADTAREFEGVFSRLFPGGEGRLVLTAPDDLLTTGIEVEARPAGKRVKRLSLLSGGERSLVAVAFLVALFRARPSPFYVLDEVEAALDDVNLGRLLDLYEELRETSQLLVVTHQKRTMEIADALYGVSMRADGISAVISQRLREPEAV